jgi:FkbM family methyltransferase
MTKLIKKVLYRLLGQANYLKTLHVSFFILYDLGLLKRNYLYKYHYFIKNIVNKGDCVVDIGANLGYFSKIFSKLVGSEGKVISIEPVKPFFDTLKWGLRKKLNCLLYNYALGLENKKIEMVLPIINGYFRTGLAHIATNRIDKEGSLSFETEMVKGSSLLNQLPKINYIKCDIEGYEEYVLPELKEIIEKQKPILQIETGGTHKIVVFNLMKELGYIQYSVYKNKLIRNFPDEIEVGDYIFIHGSSEMKIVNNLKN